MVGHAKYKNELPQENRTKKGRPFRNSQGTRAGNLSIKTPFYMENPPCLQRNSTKTIQRNRRLWSKLPQATTRYHWGRRSVWSWMDFETSKTRTRVPILYGMERIPHFGSIMGTGAGIFRQWRLTDQLQTPSSSMNTPAVITLPLLTFENMKMEQTWRLDDCLDQARWAWRFFEWYKNYLTTEDFPETSFPPPSTFHLPTYPDNSSAECRPPLTIILPHPPLMNTPCWLLPNFLDSCWIRKWILL